MKQAFKDISCVVVDTCISLILTFIFLHALLCFFAYSAMADEPLTKDERVVALTLLGEARGEGNLGMYAVGCVIQKRAEERKLTPAQVCLQRKQFSIWNGIQKEQELYYLWDNTSRKTPLPRLRAIAYARKLARCICKGSKLDQKVTGHANHYYSLRIDAPYWAKGEKRTAWIGKHFFFKLP